MAQPLTAVEYTQLQQLMLWMRPDQASAPSQASTPIASQASVFHPPTPCPFSPPELPPQPASVLIGQSYLSFHMQAAIGQPAIFHVHPGPCPISALEPFPGFSVTICTLFLPFLTTMYFYPTLAPL